MEWTVRPPREVASWILARLFADDSEPAPEVTLGLARFQEGAVVRARRALDRWGGAIIADDVGLGKTYMALALIEEALAGGHDILVTVPASLRATWLGLLGRLPRSGEARVHMRSHAQLSRGSYAEGLSGRLGLIVVDEAHRFRNPRSRRHAALLELATGARVVLLTATPINNGTGDLHALLQLLAADDAFHPLGVPSLRDIFDPLRGTDRAALSRVLNEIMIRRTRSMVGDPGATMPRRAPPRVVRYADPRLRAAARVIAGLELTPLVAFDSESRSEAAGDVRALVRLGLLKRLESGATAARISLERHRQFLRMFASAMDAGYRVTPIARQSHGVADPFQLVLLPLVSDPWPAGVPMAPIRRSVLRDLGAVDRILSTLHGPDPKLAALYHLLRSLGPDKVVVFSEFRDTAEALWAALAPRFRVGRVDGAGGWLGRQRASRMAVLHRFAPRAHGRAAPPDLQRVDVLFATDVAAEGLNLQDASHVVCYDLPWNPVRILQRIGRIDRLGSDHAEVFPYLFVPADGLEELLGLTGRIRRKLGEINALLGGRETRDLLAHLAGGTPEAAARVLDRLECEVELPMERLRALWEAARRCPVAPSGRPALLGLVTSPRGPAPAARSAVVLASVGARVFLVEVRARSAGEPGRRAVAMLERALHAPPNGSRHGTTVDQSAAGRAARIAARYLAHLQACADAPRRLRSDHPAARIVREIRARLTKDLDALDPALIDRADRLLHWLAGSGPTRLDSPLQAIADSAIEARSIGDLIETLERIAGRENRSSAPVVASAHPQVRILAVLAETGGV
jgi:hypothetical protein